MTFYINEKCVILWKSVLEIGGKRKLGGEIGQKWNLVVHISPICRRIYQFSAPVQYDLLPGTDPTCSPRSLRPSKWVRKPFSRIISLTMINIGPPDPSAPASQVRHMRVAVGP